MFLLTRYDFFCFGLVLDKHAGLHAGFLLSAILPLWLMVQQIFWLWVRVFNFSRFVVMGQLCPPQMCQNTPQQLRTLYEVNFRWWKTILVTWAGCCSWSWGWPSTAIPRRTTSRPCSPWSRMSRGLWWWRFRCCNRTSRPLWHKNCRSWQVREESRVLPFQQLRMMLLLLSSWRLGSYRLAFCFCLILWWS